MITTKTMSLFDAPDSYVLVHCISADFALGAGIAYQFDKLYGVRQQLIDLYGPKAPVCPDCLFLTNPRSFHLVTKQNFWDKPTIETLTQAFDRMLDICDMFGIKKIAMPMIGCGLDKLNWEKEVLPMIESNEAIFQGEILICKI